MVTSTKPTTEQITHGFSLLSSIVNDTPQSEGSLKNAGLVGGFILVNEDTTTDTETSLVPNTVLNSNSLITSVNNYFTFVPQSNVKIIGGRYKHNHTSSVVRTAIGGVSNLIIDNMFIEGSVTSDSAASYCLDIRDSNTFSISNCSVSKYTGGIFINGSREGSIKNLYTTNLVYHPSLVAGGYGVLLANARRILIDGLQFTANKNTGALGRHSFYISNNGDATTKCFDITLRNIMCTYTDIDDRNMWAGNIRTCDGVLVDNMVVDGANGGVAFNPEQGNLNNVRVTNSKFVILQYAEGVGVYAISGSGRIGVPNPENDLTNFIIDNCTINVRRKPGFLGTTSCVALSFGGSNSVFSNLTISTEDSGSGNTSPIYLYKSKNLSFDNIRLISAGSNPLYWIAEPISNCSFTNIHTPGVIFNIPNLIANGTDITVDWSRTANVGVASGNVTKSDNNGLISSITTDSNNVVINFNNHVTAEAVNSATLNCRTGTSANIVGISGKQITVRVFSGSTLISPATGSLNFDIKLNS